jgi:hypothetical protein
MTTQPRSVAQELAVFMLVYAAASLVHFVHNAEFLAEYPNMPSWLSRVDVYVAWLALTAIGVLGYALVGFGYRRLGLSVVVAYAVLGLDSLGHYVVARMSAHTMVMNLTIALEVTTAAALLIKALSLIARSILARPRNSVGRAQRPDPFNE